MSTHQPLCSILQSLNHACILHGTLVLGIFFINPNTRPLFTFLPSPHTHGRVQACRPHTIGPSSRRQAEALHRRCLAGREALLGAQHPDTLSSMNNLAILLWEQGKLGEAGLMVFGVGGDLPGPFTKGIFWFGQGLKPGSFSFQFPNIVVVLLQSSFSGKLIQINFKSHPCDIKVIHCWDLHPHFTVVIGQNEHNMAKLSNLSGEFLQMRLMNI